MSIHYTKSVAFAYISTPAGTTTTVAGDWYRLEGTFTNEQLRGFSIVSNKLQYGGQTQCFQITILGTFESDTAGTTLTVGIYKNGVLESNSQMKVYLKYAAEPVNVGLCDIMQLSDTNNIEIRVKSDKAGAIITASTFTTSAISV